MAENISFKERVRNVAISEADAYQKNYVENTYLIFSTQFINNDYYILSAEQDNYLHLIGVNTDLSAKEFFKKSKLGTLKDNDFNFIKINQDEKNVKGSVRRKINCLPKLKTLFFSNSLFFEENFKKNSVVCALAASDQEITLGFTHGKKSRPKTLLKGNELKKPIEIDLILSKKREELLYDNIVYGNVKILNDVVSDSLKYKMNMNDIIGETIGKSLICEEIFSK